MGIGVYRIYVANAWAGDPVFARVIAALDAYPAFLYRIDRLDPEDLAAANEGGERSTVRIAMTQAHLMLAPFVGAGETGTPSENTLGAIELELARTGFRRRIPVLGVAAEDVDPVEAWRQGFDRVVAIEPSVLSCAIQDLAEEAAAERRVANAIVMQQTPVSAPARSMPAAVVQVRSTTSAAAKIMPDAAARPLPISEIMAAYRHLVTARQSGKPIV